MSVKEQIKLELTDFEEVALEIRYKKIARNLLKDGLKVEFVSKVTVLKIKEIEELNKITTLRTSSKICYTYPRATQKLFA